MFGSHLFKLKEFEELCRHEMDALVVGKGKRITLIECPSEEAIQKFNELIKDGKTVGAIIHVTC